MPQLDYIIVFSQIFWLFTIFTIFYTFLIHFFLPKFLKALKSRKQIIELNTLEVTKIIEKSDLRQDLLQKMLVKNLILVRNILTNDLNVVLQTKENLSALSTDEKISVVIFNIAKYCDVQLLDFILLYSKRLNLKFN